MPKPGKYRTAFYPGFLGLVPARAVDLRNGRSHRAQVGRDLASMVHDIEEEAPRHRRHRPLAAEKLEGAIPARVGQRLPSADNIRALLVVDLEHLFDRRRR